MKRALKSRWVLLLTVVALLVVAGGSAWAGETRTGETITVPAGTTINDNLYASGGTVVIDGTINGNLVAAAGQVTINGTVVGNVYVGAQSLVINGTVDDVVAGAQSFKLGANGKVTQSIVFFGYSLETEQGSNIQNDVLFYGSQAKLAGNVGRDVKGGMAGFELSGSVGRNVDVVVGSKGSSMTVFMTGGNQFTPYAIATPSVNGGLRLADSAQIGGKLDYSAPEQGDIAPGAKVSGATNWTQIQPQDSRGFNGFNGFNWFSAPGLSGFSIVSELQRFVTLLLIGLLLVWIFPKWMNNMAEPIQTRPLPTLGWGFVALCLFILLIIIVPIAAILLAILFGLTTLGGLAWMTGIVGILGEIGIIVGFIVFVAYIAEAVVALAFGRWLLGLIQPTLAEGRVLPLIVGLLILVILTAIPIIGGLIGFVVLLFGLGALWRQFRRRPTTSVVVEPTPTPLPAVG